MPFDIKPKGGKFVVYNTETNEEKGEHDTEEKAKAQLAALYANVPDARKVETVGNMLFLDTVPVQKGGTGSGNFGHSGRQGIRGGSGGGGMLGGGGMSLESAATIIGGGLQGPTNYRLRHDQPLDEQDQKVVDALDAGMQPSESRMTLYRGVDEGTTRQQTVSMYGSDQRMKPGFQFTDKGFASTSTDKATATRFAVKQGNSPVLYEIDAPAGTPMLDMKDFAQFGEGEFLLARGTTFEFTGRSYDDATGLSTYKLKVA